MISRRAALLGLTALAPLAACAPATVTTDVAAGLAAAQAISGIATTLQGVSLDGLTPAQVASLGAAITQLQGIAATLTSASQPAAVASAATTVSGILADIATFLPDVTALLPLLSLVRAEPDYRTMIVPTGWSWSTGGWQHMIQIGNTGVIHQVADAPKAKLTSAQIGALRAKIAALAAAVAKAKVGG